MIIMEILSNLADLLEFATDQNAFVCYHSKTWTAKRFIPGTYSQLCRQEIILLDNEVAFNEAIIEERDQGIIDIEHQIWQANEIFRDLAVLVHEQGVVIDDVDSNIQAAASSTSQAKVQLAKASRSVKSRSSWCCWVVIIFIMVAIVLVLVLVLVL